MKKAWIAGSLIAIASTSIASEQDRQVIAKAVSEQDVNSKVAACLEREPLERDFIRLCMMAATSFEEVQIYKTAKQNEATD